ncbi:MAG: cytochrome c [Bacteroidia bacterium]|jgi:mono/diheme cytochrome c family protein|nr:cytochrome c [Bacteroidia bacterium]
MKKTTNTLFTFGAIALAAAALLSACVKSNPDSPGFEFMPDMYRSPGPETNGMYINTVTGDSLSNRLPAAGSIPRGFTVFPYANTAEGDSLAKAFWTYKSLGMQRSEANEKAGEELYNRYCMVCHGKKGDGNGPIVVSEKYPNMPPSYIARMKENNLSEGHIYHVVTYGKGVMGSHASQLNPQERMQVAQYVQLLGREGKSVEEYNNSPAPAADSTKAAPVAGAAKATPSK